MPLALVFLILQNFITALRNSLKLKILEVLMESSKMTRHHILVLLAKRCFSSVTLIRVSISIKIDFFSRKGTRSRCFKKCLLFQVKVKFFIIYKI